MCPTYTPTPRRVFSGWGGGGVQKFAPIPGIAMFLYGIAWLRCYESRWMCAERESADADADAATCFITYTTLPSPQVAQTWQFPTPLNSFSLLFLFDSLLVLAGITERTACTPDLSKCPRPEETEASALKALCVDINVKASWKQVSIPLWRSTSHRGTTLPQTLEIHRDSVFCRNSELFAIGPVQFS